MSNRKSIPIVCSKTHLRKSYNSTEKYEKFIMELNEADEFACDECGKYLSSRRSLREHKLIHGRKRHKCTKCDMKFHQFQNLKRHLTSHKNFRHQCECGMNFYYLNSLHQHQMRAKHGKFRSTDDNFKDDDSWSSMSTESDLNPPKKTFDCTECDMKFSYPLFLENHLKSHKNFRYQCDERGCGFRYCNSVILQQHQVRANHKGFSKIEKNRQSSKLTVKTHSCTKCDMKFHRMDKLKNHLNSHKNFRYQCECGFKYHNSKSLNEHQMRAKHEKFNKIEHNVVSDSESSYYDAYSPTKDYKCTMCDMSFNYKSILEKHLIAHNKFHVECTENNCGMKFSTKISLNRHQMRAKHGNYLSLNNPDKNFVGKVFYCRICGLKLHWWHSYRQHLRNHSKFRYKCECSQRFSMKDALLVHQSKTKHNKYEYITKRCIVRPRMIRKQNQTFYQCTKCDQKFIWNVSYQRHLKTHQCVCDCGRKFPNLRSLKIHLIRCDYDLTSDESSDATQIIDENTAESMSSSEIINISSNESSNTAIISEKSISNEQSMEGSNVIAFENIQQALMKSEVNKSIQEMMEIFSKNNSFFDKINKIKKEKAEKSIVNHGNSTVEDQNGKVINISSDDDYDDDDVDDED